MGCLQLPGWSVSVQSQLWEVKSLKEMCAFTSAAEKGLGSQCAGFGGCLEGLPILRTKVLPVLPAFCLPSSWLLKTCPQARLPRVCRKGWLRLCFPWVHRAISLCPLQVLEEVGVSDFWLQEDASPHAAPSLPTPDQKGELGLRATESGLCSKEKLVAVTAYVKSEERFQMNNLNLHPRTLGKEKQAKTYKKKEGNRDHCRNKCCREKNRESQWNQELLPWNDQQQRENFS